MVSRVPSTPELSSGPCSQPQLAGRAARTTLPTPLLRRENKARELSTTVCGCFGRVAVVERRHCREAGWLQSSDFVQEEAGKLAEFRKPYGAIVKIAG